MSRIATAMNSPARRPVPALILVALATVASIFLIGRLHADVSLQGMTSSGDQAGAALDRVFTHFAAVEEMLVLVSLPDSSDSAEPDVDRLLDFARRLESAIASDAIAAKQVSGVSYRADAQSRQFIEKVVAPNGLFYLTSVDYEAAKQRLTRQGMVDQFRRDEQLMAAPGPAAGALSKAFMQDPLRLHEFLLDRLSSMRPMQTYGNSDAFLAPDGRSLLIRIAGMQPPSQIEFAKQMTESISRITAQVNTDGLYIDLSGAYPIAAHSASSIRHDTISSVTSSVICLALLFVLAYRAPMRSFALAGAPVALGILFGFAAYALMRSTITPLTAVIGSMLAGIGIDYSIHYLTHYYDRRRAGLPPIEATAQTVGAIGGSLAAAWATSVVGFFAIAFASVRALREFAMVGALGLGGAFICTMVILPAVLVLTDRQVQSNRPISRVNLRPIINFIGRRGALLIALACAFMLIPLARLITNRSVFDLESDLTVLHPRPNPPLDAQQTISRRMGISPGSLIVYLTAPTNQQLVELAHDVQSRLTAPAGRDAGVGGMFSLASLLPDPRLAKERIAETGPAMADRVVADFDAAIADSPFDPTAFSGYRSFLRTLLTPTSPPGIESLAGYDQLCQAFLPSGASSSTGRAEAISLVFLRDSLDQRGERDRVLSILRDQLRDLPGVTLTGMAVLSHDTEATIRRDLPRLIIAAVLVVGIYLLAHFRSMRDAVLALVPTIFSMLCVLGAMQLTGLRLNLVNIVAIPLLVGIDVDYGIFLVGVARKVRDRETLKEHLAVSGQAIVLCAVSTVLGFGSIYYTSVPAIRSLGMVVSVGVIGCAAGSLMLLTPILLRRRGSGNRVDLNTSA